MRTAAVISLAAACLWLVCAALAAAPSLTTMEHRLSTHGYSVTQALWAPPPGTQEQPRDALVVENIDCASKHTFEVTIVDLGSPAVASRYVKSHSYLREHWRLYGGLVFMATLKPQCYVSQGASHCSYAKFPSGDFSKLVSLATSP